MEHTDKTKVTHRLKIIKGHIKAIEKMLQNDEYCINIIHQSLAVQKALKKFDMKIMEKHIQHCVPEQASAGNTEKIVEEMLSIYKYK